MEIDHCEFPDDLYYDLEALTWVGFEGEDEARIGATSLLVGLAGVLTRVKPRPGVRVVDRRRSLGTLQSATYFGALRSPLSGEVITFNEALLARPKLMNDKTYTDGWFARIRPTHVRAEQPSLVQVPDATDQIRRLREDLRVRCFRAFPDYELVEIGVECAAALAHLNDLLTTVKLGEVVHLVSDDPTAEIEMARWAYDTKQEVLETRREGTLHHFLVRRVP